MPENQHTWQKRKRHWTAVLNDQSEIQKLIDGGDFNNHVKSATETSMREQMVASLDNLANSAVNKNDTVEKIVMSKKTSLIPLKAYKHIIWSLSILLEI